MFLLLFAADVLCAQTRLVSGILKDEESGTAVAFAVISDLKRDHGTLSNESGAFLLGLKVPADSLVIESMGYVSKRIALAADDDLGVILLKPEITFLPEVNIVPEDDAYLFEMLQRCKKNHLSDKRISKAYFELKSLDDQGQIELLESYHNVHLNGMDISDIELKSGRVALRHHDRNYFLSMEGSKAVSMMRVFEHTSFFPEHPLSVSAKQAKKMFRLSKRGVFLDQEGHENILILYRPRNVCASCFEGRIIIDLTSGTLKQMSYSCKDCVSYPFVPVFPEDSIAHVKMEITKIFDGHFLKQVRLRYSTEYHSRVGKEDAKTFEVSTNAVLHCYESDQPFFIPKFHFPESLNDYKRMAAIPMQTDFWKHRDEMHIDANVVEKDRFFAHDSSITNENLFKHDGMGFHRLMRYHYVHWSANRILLGQVVDDTLTRIPPSTPISERYQLTAQIFLDLMEHGDSLVITTDAIFDPYQSYYYLEQDSITNAFVNMYFDLCETERRVLDRELKTFCQDRSCVESRYESFIKKHEEVMQRFLREVDRGTAKDAMLRWNEKLKLETGIDNLRLFGVYQ